MSINDRCKDWSVAEDKTVRDNYEHIGAVGCSGLLTDRTARAITHRAKKLGVYMARPYQTVKVEMRSYSSALSDLLTPSYPIEAVTRRIDGDLMHSMGDGLGSKIRSSGIQSCANLIW